MKPYQFNALFGAPITSEYLNKIKVENNMFVSEDKKPGPWFVMEGDWYVFSDRFHYSYQADAFAQELAEKNPDIDFIVCRSECKIRGASSVQVEKTYIL